MAKRKRNNKGGGLARQFGFSPNGSTKKIREKGLEDLRRNLELMDIMFSRVRSHVDSMFRSCMASNLPKEDTSSVRIRKTVLTSLRAEADRLGMDIHHYLASVAQFTTVYVKKDGGIDINDSYLLSEEPGPDGERRLPSGVIISPPPLPAYNDDQAHAELDRRYNDLVAVRKE